MSRFVSGWQAPHLSDHIFHIDPSRHEQMINFYVTGTQTGPCRYTDMETINQAYVQYIFFLLLCFTAKCEIWYFCCHHCCRRIYRSVLCNIFFRSRSYSFNSLPTSQYTWVSALYSGALLGKVSKANIFCITQSYLLSLSGTNDLIGRVIGNRFGLLTQSNSTQVKRTIIVILVPSIKYSFILSHPHWDASTPW